jgi:hypothetical protein
MEKYCRENNIPFDILLIIDNVPSHPARLDDFHPNVKVVLLPPNTTSVPQFLDQVVIASFKACYLRRKFVQPVEETNDGLTLREF